MLNYLKYSVYIFVYEIYCLQLGNYATSHRSQDYTLILGVTTPKLTTHDVMPADNKKAPLSDASFLSVFI